MFRDVSVIGRFNVASDHQLVRGSLNIDRNLKSNRLMNFALHLNLFQIMANSKKFQKLLEERFVELLVGPTEDVDEALQTY